MSVIGLLREECGGGVFESSRFARKGRLQLGKSMGRGHRISLCILELSCVGVNDRVAGMEVYSVAEYRVVQLSVVESISLKLVFEFPDGLGKPLSGCGAPSRRFLPVD